MNIKKVVFYIFYRDFVLYIRNISEFFSVFLFFTIITSLFVFILHDEDIFLRKIGVSVIWINVLLSILLSLDSLFKVDYNSGILEQLVLSSYPLSFLIFLKIIALWVSLFFPLVILGPLLGFFFGLYLDEAGILFLSLLLGTPVLTVLGVIGVTLILALNKGSILLTIIILPLYIPVLIFGISSILFFMDGYFPVGHFSILLFFSIVSFLLGPLIISMSLKVNYYL
ncbi:MAG TPA: heme exporter protein CcmB [Candidatus Azoamicus sp. OHIO1]